MRKQAEWGKGIDYQSNIEQKNIKMTIPIKHSLKEQVGGGTHL